MLWNEAPSQVVGDHEERNKFQPTPSHDERTLVSGPRLCLLAQGPPWSAFSRMRPSTRRVLGHERRHRFRRNSAGLVEPTA